MHAVDQILLGIDEPYALTIQARIDRHAADVPSAIHYERREADKPLLRLHGHDLNISNRCCGGGCAHYFFGIGWPNSCCPVQKTQKTKLAKVASESQKTGFGSMLLKRLRVFYT